MAGTWIQRAPRRHRRTRHFWSRAPELKCGTLLTQSRFETEPDLKKPLLGTACGRLPVAIERLRLELVWRITAGRCLEPTHLLRARDMCEIRIHQKLESLCVYREVKDRTVWRHAHGTRCGDFPYRVMRKPSVMMSTCSSSCVRATIWRASRRQETGLASSCISGVRMR